jgi:serine/threonine protein phosphatase PrpC
MEIEMNDKYVVSASDGVWDVFEDEDIQKMVVNGEGTNADELCKNIIKNALLRGTMDNISCFVIKLN